MSEQYYTLKIAGLERQLKRFSVSDTLDIAAFILFGDVELTEACAKELLKKPLCLTISLLRKLSRFRWLMK